MGEVIKRRGMGWLPNFPDFRDYDHRHDDVSRRLRSFGQTDSIKAMLKKIKVPANPAVNLPAKVDLRADCSPIENQGDIGSCTAHAAVGLVEYFERRAFGQHIDASRLFVYKVSRNLLRKCGDYGAFLRTAMEALVLFGVPPEEYWPYKEEDFDIEPPSFCYAFAQNYQAITYYCLDSAGTGREELLQRIKTYLAAKLPSMFGFTVYSSISQAENTGKIPMPTKGDRVDGGHAVMAIGYDDTMKIKNDHPSGETTKGAILIRNSWGKDWGEHGYGWLPYDYILRGLADDWWSLLKNEWVNTKQFGIE